MKEKYRINGIIFLVINIMIFIAIIYATYGSIQVIMCKINEDSINRKIENIINEEDYDIKVSLVKAKLLTKGSSGSRYSHNHTKFAKYKILENNENITITGNFAVGEKGSITNILKLEYFSTKKNLSVTQYRFIDINEKNDNVLELNNGKVKCVHNTDFSESIIIKTFDDELKNNSCFGPFIDGLNGSDTEGVYHFINSNKNNLENYIYTKKHNTVEEIFSNNFQKIGEYESEYGICKGIRKETYNKTKENLISVEYILYLEHPIELIEKPSDIVVGINVNEKSSKIVVDGIKISITSFSKDNFTNTQFWELCKKMLPAKK